MPWEVVSPSGNEKTEGLQDSVICPKMPQLKKSGDTQMQVVWAEN